MEFRPSNFFKQTWNNSNSTALFLVFSVGFTVWMTIYFFHFFLGIKPEIDKHISFRPSRPPHLASLHDACTILFPRCHRTISLATLKISFIIDVEQFENDLPCCSFIYASSVLEPTNWFKVWIYNFHQTWSNFGPHSFKLYFYPAFVLWGYKLYTCRVV